MLIQCLFDCPEEGIYLGEETYHFRPENDRICDVVIKTHQERFLSRSKSYRAVEAAPVVEPEHPIQAPQIPKRRTRRFTPPQQAVLMPDEDRT